MFQANPAHSCGITTELSQCIFNSIGMRSKLPFKSWLYPRFDGEPREWSEPTEASVTAGWVPAGAEVWTVGAVSPLGSGAAPSAHAALTPAAPLPLIAEPSPE